ncbi:hypothetical protein RP20_CCG012762 [Aedes albopictus]|nr:hypothetical protein RP20_CCG012762 [Aedes albopictus]
MIVEPMKQTTSNDVIRTLKEIFTRMGLPQVITLDNAKNFSSQLLKDFCVDRGIKLTHTTPYWPSANGEAERQNQSLLKVLRISQNKGTDWKEALQEYMYMYSITPHSTTGVAPAKNYVTRTGLPSIKLRKTGIKESEQENHRSMSGIRF